MKSIQDERGQTHPNLYTVAVCLILPGDWLVHQAGYAKLRSASKTSLESKLVEDPVVEDVLVRLLSFQDSLDMLAPIFAIFNLHAKDSWNMLDLILKAT